MLVSEFIKLWDTVNITKTFILYYYKDQKIFKHELYKIMDPLETINITYKVDELHEENINIYHNKIDYSSFNYDQKSFYNNLKLEIPEGTFIGTLHMYIN